MQKSYITHVPKQKKSAQLSHFFRCLPPLLRKEVGLKTQQKATGTTVTFSVIRRQIFPTTNQDCPRNCPPGLSLVLTKPWYGKGLRNISSLSTCHRLNLVSGSHWQKGEKVSFNFHKIRNVAGVLWLFLLSAFFLIHSFNWLFNSGSIYFCWPWARTGGSMQSKTQTLILKSGS